LHIRPQTVDSAMPFLGDDPGSGIHFAPRLVQSVKKFRLQLIFSAQPIYFFGTVKQGRVTFLPSFP
jgi:hypothetical protein